MTFYQKQAGGLHFENTPSILHFWLLLLSLRIKKNDSVFFFFFFFFFFTVSLRIHSALLSRLTHKDIQTG